MRSFIFTSLRCSFPLVLTIIAGLTLTAVPANASRLWKWHYTASGITAGGTLTTPDRPNANGGYLITQITGTRNGSSITALQAPGTSIPGNEPFLVDDLVFPGPGPQLTSHGFGFSISGGTYSNPFYADFLPTPGYLEFFSTPPSGHTELAVQFSATPIPEPATCMLVFSGLALAGLRLRSR
jgi:hypothetical protein